MAHQTFFKHQMKTRTQEDNEAEVQRAANWANVCRKVNERDDYRCRVCGRRPSLTSLSLRERGHHHHIVYRSRGGMDFTANIVLLCAQCHDLVHIKKALAIEGNADEAPWLTMSRRDEDGVWYVSAQECGVRLFARD